MERACRHHQLDESRTRLRLELADQHRSRRVRRGGPLVLPGRAYETIDDCPMRNLNWRALAIASLLFYGANSHGSMAPIAGDPIATRSGKISGTRLSSGVGAYLGIPYARAPVGQLRWAPPRQMQWDGVWNADRTGPECIQVLRPHNINHYFGEEPTSEDCLYLNLWVPPKSSASDKLPVIVFIYGGGGTVGSSGMAVYSGERVAARGAIFV